MADYLIGKTINHYQILSLLGKSGMGEVYKARDITLHREVAIKILYPQFAQKDEFRERFLREARAAAIMDCPGIVRIYDFGQEAELLYIVMEYLSGSNLRELLTGLQATNRWIPLPEAVELGRQVCLAVAYAHSRGVLHRDIKPENIMLKLGQTGILPYRPVLTDLGLARLLNDQTMTQVGVSIGTPAYMSPEQALGQTTDIRSDIYSLGVLLFELTTGRLPFPAKTITEAICYHTKEPPSRPSSICPRISTSLDVTILKALEKNPSARFQSAESLAQALSTSDSFFEGIVETATVIGAGEVKTQLSPSTDEFVDTEDASSIRGNLTEEVPANQQGIEPLIQGFIEPCDISVEPGDEARVSLKLLNQGDVDKEFELSVDGIPEEWIIGLPDTIRLLPRKPEEISLTIIPPRVPQASAGSYNIQLCLYDLITSEKILDEPFRLDINSFYQFGSELLPEEIKAGQTAKVLIINQSNIRDTFVVTFEDQSLEFVFEPSQVKHTVLEGEQASIEFRVISQTSGIQTTKKIHPFIARVCTGSGYEEILEGRVITGVRIPLWIMFILVLACLIIISLIGVLPVGRGGQPLLAAFIARSSTPTITDTITPSPTNTSTLTPTNTQTPTDTPTPVFTSATPTQVYLAASGKPWYVLWDLTHGPRQSSETGDLYEPDGLYSQLKSELDKQGIILVPNRDPLEQVDLSKYSLIVIAMTSAEKQNYTVAEAQIIGEFVNHGGSLLVLAENPDYPNRIREVIDYYDIDLGQGTITKAITELEEHPIFKNVNQVYFEFEGGTINTTNKQARVVASKNGKAAIVVIENLPGRVVVVGDSNLFDNRGLWRNKQFAINLFRWLT